MWQNRRSYVIITLLETFLGEMVTEKAISKCANDTKGMSLQEGIIQTNSDVDSAGAAKKIIVWNSNYLNNSSFEIT